MMLDTADDRTIYFDLLPFYYVSPGGMKIKLKVFTVPGQVRHDATRKAVLQRADGVVFVADSQRHQMTVNFESFENLETNLSLVGLSMDRLPLVIQFNKQDLTDVISEDEIRKTWGPSGLPITLSSALKGWGVVDTFRTALESIYDNLDGRLNLSSRYGVEREAFFAEIIKDNCNQNA